MNNKNALVTQIQKFAVNDGPGFRTNVFLKGCPLKCKWCHNPETQAMGKELYWKNRLCVQCGECVDACPLEAINEPIPPEEAQQEGSTYDKIIRDSCDKCMKCVDACNYSALEVAGKEMTIEEIIEEVEQDRPFYNNSGGGMTISGGEPLFHKEFSEKLIDSAIGKGLHVCIDTSGYCKWEDLEQLADKVDLILYDLKHVDSKIHKELTGVPNEPIISNLRKLLEKGVKVWLRIVIMPDLTDSYEYHQKMVELIKTLPKPPARIDLLPYHNWCQDKYRWLGRDWDMEAEEALDNSEVEPIKELYDEAGFNVTIGGSGFEES